MKPKVTNKEKAFHIFAVGQLSLSILVPTALAFAFSILYSVFGDFSYIITGIFGFIVLTLTIYLICPEIKKEDLNEVLKFTSLYFFISTLVVLPSITFVVKSSMPDFRILYIGIFVVGIQFFLLCVTEVITIIKSKRLRNKDFKMD